MTKKTYTIRRKVSVGWKKKIKNIINNEQGGAFGIILLAIFGFLLLLTVFITIVDYSVYSVKRNNLTNALDLAVCAAVQEIDIERSKEGLSKAFMADGTSSLSRIYLNEIKANSAFYSTIKENLNISVEQVKPKVMTIISNPIADGANYIIQYGETRREGVANRQKELEDIINLKVQEFANNSDEKRDKHTVYVNGNIHTNEFKNRPYYMVFIRDYQINGLISHRTATFICFKGATITR